MPSWREIRDRWSLPDFILALIGLIVLYLGPFFYFEGWRF